MSYWFWSNATLRTSLAYRYSYSYTTLYHVFKVLSSDFSIAVLVYVSGFPNRSRIFKEHTRYELSQCGQSTTTSRRQSTVSMSIHRRVSTRRVNGVSRLSSGAVSVLSATLLQYRFLDVLPSHMCRMGYAGIRPGQFVAPLSGRSLWLPSLSFVVP